MTTTTTLREARLAAGLGFCETARLARVSESALNYWERGVHKPRALARESLARVLGVDESSIDWTVSA